jgi:hypothetical protein
MRASVVLWWAIACALLGLAVAGCEASHCECYDTGARKDGPASCIETCAELFV